MTDLHPHPVPCYRCGCTLWDCYGQRESREGGRIVVSDLLECVYCGILEKVIAVTRQRLVPQERGKVEAFRFSYGRFKGMTFAEADAEPNGRRYLEHLRDTNEKLRSRIEEYLNSAAPSAVQVAAP